MCGTTSCRTGSCFRRTPWRVCCCWAPWPSWSVGARRGGPAEACPTAAAQLFGVPALRIVAGGAVLWLFYFVLRLVYPPGMGFGDVKLAGVLGMYLGYLGWPHVFAGTFAAFLLGGMWSIGLLALRRGTLKSAIPFGPFMLAGAAAAHDAAACLSAERTLKPHPSANGHLSPHPPAAPLNAAAARLRWEGGRPPSYLREAVGT